MIATFRMNDFVREAPRVYTSQSCRETEKILLQNPESECIVVCDKSERPVGLVMCDRFFLKLHTPFGFEMFYRESVIKLMNRTPLIVDINSSIDELLVAAAKRPDGHRNDCVIVTAQGKISGVLCASDLSLIRNL